MLGLMLEICLVQLLVTKTLEHQSVPNLKLLTINPKTLAINPKT